MLENTVENGERPEDLIIYSGTAQAARNWESYHEIVRQLINLAHDETLVIQSGKPVAVFRTTTESPRVVIANTNLVGNWATWERYHELKSRDLIIWGQYTAGDWQYIGQQGILQSTYETLAVCARTNFGSDLSGRLFLSSGLGAMGGAQPFAAKFLGAASIIVEVDESSADRHIKSGYLEQKTSDIGEAMRLAAQAVESTRGSHSSAAWRERCCGCGSAWRRGSTPLALRRTPGRGRGRPRRMLKRNKRPVRQLPQPCSQGCAWRQRHLHGRLRLLKTTAGRRPHPDSWGLLPAYSLRKSPRFLGTPSTD